MERVTAVLYRLFYTGLFLAIGFSLGGRLLGVGTFSLGKMVVAFLILCIYVGLTVFRGKQRLLFVLALLACGLVWLISGGLTAILENAASYGSWLVGGSGWEVEKAGYYQLVQTAGVAVGCCVLQFLAERFRLAEYLTVTAVAVFLVLALFRGEEVSHMGAVASFFYLALACVQWNGRHGKQQRTKDEKTHILWLSPFLFLYLLGMSLAPAPEKPYDWAFFLNLWDGITEQCAKMTQQITSGSREELSEAVCGFSEDGRLFGALSEGSREVMTIKGQEGLLTNIYLTGKIWDTFDGREWRQNYPDYGRDRKLDLLELLYAAERYDGENRRNYIVNTKLKIQYRYLNTGYLFLPLKTWEIRSNRSAVPFYVEEDDVLYGDKRGYGDGYEASYFQLNVDSPAFYQFLETELPEDEELFDRLSERYADGEFNLANLEEYRERVHEAYLPETELGEEVKQWLSDVTENCETDVEKLKRIEQELNSYTYTMTPGELPDSVVDADSFLRYFLLESRQGYCAYYATAFVLLARAEGLPARYVEGFCVPTEKDRSMEVTGDMAHAWAEVYFEGVGWIPFEPTAGYETLRYTPWAFEPESTESREGTGYWQAETEAEEISTEESFPPAEQKEEKAWKWWLVAVPAAVLFPILFFWLDFLWNRYRYAGFPEEKRFLLQVAETIRVLGWLGIKREESETLEEFAKRVLRWQKQQEIPGEGAKAAEEQPFVFLRMYEEYLYGGCEVTPEMTEQVFFEKKKLIQKLAWYQKIGAVFSLKYYKK